MSTVCILYGFCEGPRTGVRFERALGDKGYRLTADPKKADILITHSGGCLLLPEKPRAKQIVHIGPYFWPEKSWFRCAARKLSTDFQIHRQHKELGFWFYKSIWNCIYFWRMPRNIQMARGIHRQDRWHYGDKTLVVRPRFDSFCTPSPKSLPFTPHAAFVSVPGHHDDCWRDPAPYIALLQ